MADRSVQVHAIAGRRVPKSPESISPRTSTMPRSPRSPRSGGPGSTLSQHHPISGYNAWRGAMHRVTLAGGQPR